MGNSLITKKKIAFALKRLMMTTDFEKISIVDIMENAQMRRQTFYSHFMDKFDLVEWIFQTELSEQVQDNLDYVTAEILLGQLAYFLSTNQDFYHKIFQFDGQNNFHTYFVQFCQQIIEKVINDYEQEYALKLNHDNREFFVEYHSFALASYYQQLLQKNKWGDFKEYIPYLLSIINASLSAL